jgi:tetratricopeptide (TPR) repeat protein
MSERELFIAAMQIPDQGERSAWLDRECGGDGAARQRIEALLRALDQAGSLLDHPVVAPAPTTGFTRSGLPAPEAGQEPLREGPGMAVGPYKLLEQIGEGGFGVVFMAEQQHPVRRRVALKVLKPGMDTRQVVARFEAERQALALMDHPHIAKVLDGGETATGRPFFVMDLVKGVPITHYCDQNQLTARERLELFVQVCQAVQHAHQKGIIHRDLKPTNVLVSRHDGTPVVKVIDFGIAKALGQQLTDKTLFTHFAQLIGTPLYMSPEQAGLSDLDVDTRSDIYALGVLLYELLTGTTPFDPERLRTAGYDEMRRIIREEEPPKPSTRISTLGQAATTVSAQRRSDPKQLSRLFRGELDWIVMRALEKDRNRRYESASAFAADVQRYLHDEPVQACPPSAWYRFGKFARRNRTALAGAGLVLFCIAVLGGGGGWVVRDRAAREKVRRDREAETGRAAAQALDDARHRLDEERLPEATAAVARAETLVATADADEASRARVREARRDVDLVADLDDIQYHHPTVTQYEWSREQHRRFEKVFADLGIDADAVSTDEAVRRIESHPLRLQLVAALDGWAYARHNIVLVETRRGGAWWHRPLLIANEADPDEVRRRLRAAVMKWDYKAMDDLAASPDVGRLPAPTVMLLARELYWSGSAERQEAAIRVLKKARSRHPDHFGLNASLGNYLGRLGAPRYEEALSYWRAAQALGPQQSWVRLAIGLILVELGRADESFAELSRATELDPNNAMVHNDFGSALGKQGKRDEAVAELRKSVALDPALALPHSNLGTVLRDQKKLDEAVAEFRMAIALDPKYAMAHNNLGTALHDQRKLDEAIVCYKKAIRLDPKHAFAHNNLGAALAAQGKLDEAIVCYKKAIRLDPKHAFAHNNLGNALKRQGKLDEAAAEYRKAIALDPKSAPMHDHLGRTLVQQKKLDEAVAEYRKAIALDPKYAPAHCNLGIALKDQGKVDEAIAEYRKAIALKHDDVAAHNNLGNALRDQGKVDEAIAEYRKAIALDPALAPAHNNLGNALKVQGRPDEAIAQYKEALRIKPDYPEAHYGLGLALAGERKLDEAIAAYRKAIALKPDYAEAHYDLGNALRGQDKLDEAVAAYRKAITLKPDYAEAHCNLGEVLKRQGRPVEAVAEYKEALRIKPDLLEARNNLGSALHDQGRLDEAIAEYKQALRIKPDHPEIHYGLGLALHDQGKLDEAIAEYRKAIALDPKEAKAHNNLGNALLKQGKLDEAIAEYREAIGLQPDRALAHCNLGFALQQRGEFREALGELRRGHELGFKRPGWPYPSAQWVLQCERLVELDGKLPGFLEGKATPASAAERIELALLCQLYLKQYAAAARFYEEAFADQPKLAEKLGAAGSRYDAACAAALAGCGRGKDADKLDAKEKARLRGRALAWLRADLEAMGRLLDKGADPARLAAGVGNVLRHWQADPDLAGVRGAEALGKLPAAERQAWKKLWDDAADVLARAQAKTTPGKKSGAK